MGKHEMFAIACDLAATYHEGQKYFKDRDDGSYYVDHLMPVSLSATRFAPAWLHPMDVQTVGILHDILEDTDCTADILLSKGIPAYIVEAVILLTHIKTSGISHRQYIERLKHNPLSLAVKISDSHFNLTNSLIERNEARVMKYTTYLKWMIS